MGAKVGEELLDWTVELGIKTLTLYVFSTEHFERQSDEVKGLLKLIEGEARRLACDRRLHSNMVRVKILARTDLLPTSLQEALVDMEKSPKHYGHHFLTVAI